MSNILDDCFNDHGAEFYRDVFFKGQKIGRIRAFRFLDNDAFTPYLGKPELVDGKPTYTQMKLASLALAQIVVALGGELDGVSYKVGDEGWESERPVTFDNAKLLPNHYREAFSQAINELEADFRAAEEGLEGN